MNRKICVVVTARPSYSRIKTAIKAINRHRGLDLQLVVAASALLDRYGNAVQIIKSDGFEVAAEMYNVLEGENLTSMAKTAGLGILELSTIFDNLKPDVVVTVADRFETISTAVAASYMNIPLVHVQGGEVTGSIDEKVRHAITKMADLHLVSSELARERVIKMGENPEKVIKTGCPSIDLIKELSSLQLDFDPYQKYGGVGFKPPIDNGFIVVLQHPVTSEYHDARKHVESTLFAISELKIPTLWFWPNMDAGSDGTSKGIRAFREFEDASNIHFFKNMNPSDFIKLIGSAKVLVGNSSAGIRESSYLGTPVVNIGSRQNGRQRAKNVLDVGYDKNDIKSAIQVQMSNGQYESEDLYGNGNAGLRIAEVLATEKFEITKQLQY